MCESRWQGLERRTISCAVPSSFRARSSAGEHSPHTRGVAGSIPAAPTMFLNSSTERRKLRIAIFSREWKDKDTKLKTSAMWGNEMSPDSNSGPALIGIEPTIYPDNDLTQRPLARAKFLKNTWYVAMPSEELKEGEIVHRTILNQPVAIYRKEDGGVAAIRDMCPHRQVPLSMGTLQNKDIFFLSVFGISLSDLQIIISGCIPKLLNSLTECCVGFVFSSPDAFK